MIGASLLRQSHASQLKKFRPTFSGYHTIFKSLRTFASNLSSDADSPQNGHSNIASGTLTARILPKDKVEYRRTKPATRYENIDFLKCHVVRRDPEKRISLEEEPIASHEMTNFQLDDNQDWVVALDVDVKTTIRDNNSGSEPVHVSLHLHRQANETARRTLHRLELSTQRKVASYRHGRKKTPSTCRIESASSQVSDIGSSLLLVQDLATNGDEPDGAKEDDDLDGYRNFPVNEDLKSYELWLSIMKFPSSILTLDLKEETIPSMIPLTVVACPPTILSIQTFEDFTANVFAGVPLVIETKVVHADRALIVWFADGKQVCYDSSVYTPTEADVGKEISILVSPVRPGLTSGYEEAFYFVKRVELCPPMPVVQMRTSWLASRNDDPCIRVMSYNLLADLYASREVDQKVMYNHCDREFLIRKRRMPLLIYEILAYHPDVVCLQEVDAGVYHDLLRPVLESHGFRGYYSNKVSAQLEGEFPLLQSRFELKAFCLLCYAK